MIKAILMYTTKDTNNPRSITLESGSLFYVDHSIKNYKNVEEIKNSFNYQAKIGQYKDGEIELFCIRDNETREKLPLLINDNNPLIIRDDYYNNRLSELERSRKLLLNSKNRMFINGFLKSHKFTDALNFNIKLSYAEYRYLTKQGISLISGNDAYYIEAEKLFIYASQNSKLGLIRLLFETSLDIWKERISNLTEDELYYYSRNLRILINEYYSQLKTPKGIRNLKTYKHLVRVALHNNQISEPNNVKTKRLQSQIKNLYV